MSEGFASMSEGFASMSEGFASMSETEACAFLRWRKQKQLPEIPSFDMTQPQFFAQSIYMLARSIWDHNHVEIWKKDVDLQMREREIILQREIMESTKKLKGMEEDSEEYE